MTCLSLLNVYFLKLFADDTNGFYAGYDLDALFDNIQDDMESFNKWIRANKVTINFDPTKSCYRGLKPGVHLIVTIAEKSVSDQMDTSLLAIPTTTKVIAIAGIDSSSKRSSGHWPAIVNDQNDRHICQSALQFRLISC